MPHYLRGLVLHRHHTLGVAKDHTRSKAGMAGKQWTKHGFVTVQDHVHPGMLGQRIDKTGNNRCRSPIATHGVNRNDNALGSRGRRRPRVGSHGIVARAQAYAASSSMSTSRAIETTSRES